MKRRFGSHVIRAENRSVVRVVYIQCYGRFFVFKATGKLDNNIIIGLLEDVCIKTTTTNYPLIFDTRFDYCY